MAIKETSFIVLEDGTRNKKQGTEVYEGQPVKINADGDLEPATNAAAVFGISKLDSNQYRDLSFGEFGAFGSNKLTVVAKGILLLSHSVFNQVEVENPLATTAAVTVKMFDDTQTYVPGQELYVNGSGLITNQRTGNEKSLFGKCLRAAAAGATELELLVDPGTHAPDALA